MCEEVNNAIMAGLREGIITSASAMVPSPAFTRTVDFAQSNPEADIGIHLTLTSEWPAYRWRPVLGAERVPSLVDTDGCFWRTAAELFAHARLEEAEEELRAQLDTAINAGIDVTHIDSHMFVLDSWCADYYRLYVKLALEYRLPFRSIRRTVLHWCTRIDVGASRVRRLGFISPDHLIFISSYNREAAFTYWSSILSTIAVGVTEVYCHPGLARGQLVQFAADADQRQADFEFFTSSEARRLLRDRNVHLITYRELRDQMRTGNHYAAGRS
jgi:hypothetical protein